MQIPEDFRCCICLSACEAFLLTGCQHKLCCDCVKTGEITSCPVCTAALPEEGELDEQFMQKCAAKRLRCACGADVALLQAEGHTCDKTAGRESPKCRRLETSQEPPPSAPNRSTFSCPVCKEPNLSRQGLLDHCNAKHASRPISAVCPVCLAMPWGDPSYVSRDFLSHLNLRHRCDYDVLADYEADEEAMFQRALEASMLDAFAEVPAIEDAELSNAVSDAGNATNLENNAAESTNAAAKPEAPLASTQPSSNKSKKGKKQRQRRNR
mmetsp:Transcript_80817/g.140325  ORF Transcript_80817/g.140325 Transcript_80817/m.140325 type:complete len:268 (-) Transcript_80817:148-951(-)